jgi:hypothetical protein
MKINDFMKELEIEIQNAKIDENLLYVLVRISDQKHISPAMPMKDSVIQWIKKNTEEIYFKLFYEED